MNADRFWRIYVAHNAGCHSDSASDDAVLLLRMQAMDETHGVTLQQMDVSHSMEQEAALSTSQELQYELQTEPVSDFWHIIVL